VLSELHVETGGGGAQAVPARRVEEREVAHPSAAGGILRYAAEHDADVIVMGTHGRRGVQRLLIGSVAEEVVRRAECPVFTIRSSDEDPDADEPVPRDVSVGRILVPVDLSEHTDALVAHAQEVALAYDASIELLHVVERVALPPAYGLEPLALDSTDVKERAREDLDRRADELSEDGIEVFVTVRTGYPSEVILESAADGDVDLVMVATHGFSGVKRLLLGSVAERVVRRVECPVLTVKSYGKSLVDA
jgi:nucleotide-binding universal stress UspA family protein